jgi:oxygen-independent coproporphyrinogen-3 oxidase
MDQVSGSILSELLQRKHYLAGQQVETIYFGGGTPSLLNTSDVERIIQTIFSTYSVLPGAEITLEAIPTILHPKSCLS